MNFFGSSFNQSDMMQTHSQELKQLILLILFFFDISNLETICQF